MIWNERNLLCMVKSTHLVRMHYSFQDNQNCYVIMDLLLGGDLRYHLNNKYQKGYPESHVKFYVAGIILSLQYLHSLRVLVFLQINF